MSCGYCPAAVESLNIYSVNEDVSSPEEFIQLPLI